VRVILATASVMFVASSVALSIAPPTTQDLYDQSEALALVRIVASVPDASSDDDPLRCGVRYTASVVEGFRGSSKTVEFFESTLRNEIPAFSLVVGREYLVALTSQGDFAESFLSDCERPRPPYLRYIFALQSPWQTSWYGGLSRVTASCGAPPFLEVLPETLEIPDGVRSCAVLPSCGQQDCSPTLEGRDLVSWPEMLLHLRSLQAQR